MKKPVCISIARVAVGLIVATLAAPAWGQELAQEAELSPAETMPHLPVAVRLSLRNAASVPLPYVRFQLMASLGIRIWREGENEAGMYPVRAIHGFSQCGFVLRRPPKPILQPGETYTRKDWIILGGRNSPFPSPGRYVIHSDYADRPFPRLVVTIREPRRDEQEAAALMDHPAIRRMFEAPFEKAYLHLPRGSFLEQYPAKGHPVTNLEELVRRFPDSPYGLHGAYILAGHRAASAFLRDDEGQGETTPPPRLGGQTLWDLRQAVELLEDLDRRGPPENLRREVQLDLARFHLRLGERAEARDRLNRLAAEDLPEPLATTYAELLEAVEDSTGGAPRGE